MWASTAFLLYPTKLIEMACNNEIDWLYSLLQFLCCRIYKRQGKVKFYIRLEKSSFSFHHMSRAIGSVVFKTNANVWLSLLTSLFDDKESSHCSCRGGFRNHVNIQSEKTWKCMAVVYYTWLVCLLCNSSLACLIAITFRPPFAIFLVIFWVLFQTILEQQRLLIIFYLFIYHQTQIISIFNCFPFTSFLHFYPSR